MLLRSILLALCLMAVAESATQDVEADSVNLLQTPKSSRVTKKHSNLLETATDSPATTLDFKAAGAEFVAMALFVVICCGSAMGVAGDGAWVLQVALAFGLSISALALAIGPYSGGQINCAVTFGLVLAGKCSMYQGLLNLAAQVLGSITGALLLTVMYTEETDKTKGLATNEVQEGKSWLNALVGEAVMTFLLMFTVLETAVKAPPSVHMDLAVVAIGFAVFLAHSVLIPVDGCSINPTRSLGPAIVRKLVYKNSGSLADMWIFWAGPLLGAAGAVAVSSAIVAV